MYILGLSFYYHNSSACLIKDGDIIAATEEERFTRIKNDADFPTNAINFCLDFAKININQINYIVFYEKPFIKLERITISQIQNWPKGFLNFPTIINSAIKKNTGILNLIKKETGYSGEILFTNHHESHSASAFFTSPFDDSAIITIDGVGEWNTTTIGIGEGNQIKILDTIDFPNSLGLFYSAFTYYLGFEINEGEYKLMGLSPYGEPKYIDLIYDNIIKIHDDSSYTLNLDFFEYMYSFKTINEKKFQKLFGIPKRNKQDKIEQIHKDIAASVQQVLEEILIGICKYAKNLTQKNKLCLAGGVALNCVANSKILLEKIFEDVWIFPASGDAGGSVGACLFAWYNIFGNSRSHPKQIDNVFWGPEFTDEEIQEYLDRTNIIYKKYEDNELFKVVSKYIQEQKVIGWFQGRMEFGPRSLGNRSIIADARNPDNWQKVNLKIKFRESFRPFAPSILEEQIHDFFSFPKSNSPFMLFTAQNKTNLTPATTHVDNSSRLQTVSEDNNLKYYNLIKQFFDDTGIPVIINTSFNTSGMPIVCTPQNAYQCFLQTQMDILVLGNFVISKSNFN